MNLIKLLTGCCIAYCFTAPAYAQNIYENTFVWEAGKDHSGWKGISNFPTGYVVAGSKFFETSNTQIFMTGFNDLCQHEWTTTHTTTQHGFTQLDVFWKILTNTGAPSNPSGFFLVASGTRNGARNFYTFQTDKAGQFISERFGPLGGGVTFGGVCQTPEGGYIAVGGNNVGEIAVAKFNAAGELETTKSLGISGFAWTVQPASGGGFVIGSTQARATRINDLLDVNWTTTVTLPASPPPDGSMFTYTEFEEIVPLLNAGTGFIMTGSAFSNSTSAVYTSRINWDGTVAWNKINDAADTSQTSTPVAWSNSPVERFNSDLGTYEILYTWRKGPVSAGGTLFAERMNPANGAELQKASLQNSIPVQEAFTVRQYFTDRIIIAGTRGGYGAAYAYSGQTIPPPVMNGAAPASDVSGTVPAARVTNAPR